MNKKKFFFFFVIINIIFCVNIKEKNKNKNKNSKECSVYVECKACIFSELKSQKECQFTGYKKIIKCYFNEKKMESFYDESCNENIKINKIYYFLLLNIIILIISYNLRKKEKEMTINNVMNKLSILKNN
jgi:hypothetical protein